jgi:pyruvate dehydrogenase (quinone)
MREARSAPLERYVDVQGAGDGAHLGRRHPVDIAVVGDITPTLEALLPKITARWL